MFQSKRIVHAAALCGVLAVFLVSESGAAQEQSDMARVSQASGADMLAYGEQAKRDIEQAARTVGDLVSDIERDPSATAEARDCVVMRHTAIQAMIPVTHGALDALSNALATGSRDLAGHQARKIAVAASKTRVMLAEAQSCASSKSADGATTLVDWTTTLGVQPDLPDLDLTDFAVEPDPPPGSPFF